MEQDEFDATPAHQEDGFEERVFPGNLEEDQRGDGISGIFAGNFVGSVNGLAGLLGNREIGSDQNDEILCYLCHR